MSVTACVTFDFDAMSSSLCHTEPNHPTRYLVVSSGLTCEIYGSHFFLLTPVVSESP